MSDELHTLISALLPPTGGIRLTDVTVEDESVRLQLTVTASTAACPACAVPVSSIHSRYQRHLTDLPWGIRAVRLQLTVRKFLCRHPTCVRRIFTERLPDLVAAYARKTCRLVAALQAIGMALGGNAGARLAARLRIPTSAATLLLLVQGAPIPPMPGPKRPQWRSSAQVLTPYIRYLTRRWHECGGHTDSVKLWHEIQALGYTHSALTVYRFITRLRRTADAGRSLTFPRSPYTRPEGPSARAVSFAIVSPAAGQSIEAQTYVDQLCQAYGRIARANTLIQALLTMARERRGYDLGTWIAEAIDSGIEVLTRFARGLQGDLIAIQAGLTLEWSNGVTEGQIHRLKLVKRQGYGWTGFALLRQRVLRAA